MAVAIVERLIALAQLALLARLLQPDDFGIYAMAMIVVAAGMVFTSLGTERILVQRPELEDGFIGSLWMVEILRGLFVTLFCLLMSPFYAAWMHAPDVEQVLYILACVPLFSSLRTPAQVIAERMLHFKSAALFQGLSSCVQFLILCSLAYIYRDVFALALGFASMALVRSVLSWLWFGIPHLPRFHAEDFRELFSVGRHYFVIALGGYAMTQGDNLMVGNMLGTAVLGYYVLAYQISQWPVDILNNVIGRVALPVFSRLQEDVERLRRAFDQVLQIQLALLVPVVTGIFLFAPLLVNVVLGEKYQESVIILQLLLIVVMGRGISHVLIPFIIGAGHVQFASRVKVYEAALFLLAVWIGIDVWGVQGAATGAGIGYLFAAMARVIFVCRMACYPFSSLLKHAFFPLLASLCAALVVELAVTGSLLPEWGELVGGGLIFLVVYAVVSLVMHRSWLTMLKELVRSRGA